MDLPGIVGGLVKYEGRQVSPQVQKFVGEVTSRNVVKDSVGFARSHESLVRRYRSGEWWMLFQEPIYSFESNSPVVHQLTSCIRSIARRSGNDQQSLEARLSSYLDEMGLSLDKVSFKTNRELSGGECQRITLALALAVSPRLLFADEPTTAIDSKFRRKIYEKIDEHRHERQLGLILSTHNRDELLELTEGVLIICSGRIVETVATKHLKAGSIEQFHPYTRKLWHSVGTLDSLPAPSPNERSSLLGCPFAHECTYAARDPKLKNRCMNEFPPYFGDRSRHTVACWLFDRDGNDATL